MVNISLLEMGRTKKRNVREAVISILGRNFPLTIRKIYNQVNKEYHLGVTYQAVFKILKELTEDCIVQKENKEYRLDMNWIKQLENELEVIKHNYGGSEKSEEKEQSRINSFIAEIGPKIMEYAGHDNICIVGLIGSGHGDKYAISMWRYLLRERKNANFVELSRYSLIKSEPIKLSQKDFENRKVIIVDDEIIGGTNYRLSMKRLSSLKGKLKIKDIKYAVYKDAAGLADFSLKKE